MAGRLVFQKLASSGLSRSASRLVGAQASAYLSRATAPVITRAPEDGIRNLSNCFHDAAPAAVHLAGLVVVPSNHGGIRGYVEQLQENWVLQGCHPCLPPRVPAKIRRFKARMSPGINNHNKSSALVDSVGEVKPTSSSDASSNQLKLVEEPWHSRLVDWVSKKQKGLHRLDIFLLKLRGCLEWRKSKGKVEELNPKKRFRELLFVTEERVSTFKRKGKLSFTKRRK